jgi:hypothetical protein
VLVSHCLLLLHLQVLLLMMMTMLLLLHVLAAMPCPWPRTRLVKCFKTTRHNLGMP